MYLGFMTPVYFFIVILFDVFTEIWIYRFKFSIVPPALVSAEFIYIELPIALITKGELVFSPFKLITFPSHVIEVVEIIL